MIPLSDPRSWDHQPPPRPAPECLDYRVTCVRCGCWIEAGENVYVRGGETECWGECAP